ncbi:MAG: hypothetical protein NZR01_15150 [Bryobacteraceae bacterium]|nr:hypothetical protein [Bryobacteraceae bacterium]
MLAAWFLHFAWPGLLAWFTPDDLMNLHGVAFLSPWQIAAAKERPAANLVLRGLWELFGLHPRPYRVFCFGLLLANLWLALRLFQRASGSWNAVLFGGLFFAYHAQLQDLYFNTGTIYDLLAFAFSISALLCLPDSAENRVPFPAGRAAAAACLAALAGGSKEVAVTLPAVMALAAWAWNGGRAAWKTAALASACCWAVLGWSLWRSPMGANPAYQPEFSLAVLNARWKLLTADLLYRGPDWSPAAAWLLLAAAVLAAAWLRRRAAWLALGILLLTPLPLLFLPQRSFYAFYIPYAGWCLLAGMVLDRLWSLLPLQRPALPCLLVAALAFLLAPQHRWLSAWIRQHYYAPYERRVVTPGNVLRRSLPPLPRGAAIYFADDPLPPAEEEPHLLAFLCRLKARDPQLSVWRARNPGQNVPESEWGRFAAVFRLTHTELIRIR